MAGQGRVGFLGLGIMGARMAEVLVKSGRNVTVWNRSAARCEPLKAAGASVAADAAEVTQSCDITFAMLSDPAAASAVVKAAAPGMGPGRTYVDCSTVDEATGESSASVISATGGKFLAAPVSGGWRDAAKGELLFICGGEKAAFDAASPLMDVMGAQSWHTGKTPSHASRAKLMLQIMMGTMIGSLAECLALSKASGVDQTMVLQMLMKGAMANPLIGAKGKLMIEGKFDPNFQVYLQQKDLRLAQALAEKVEVPAPITAAANAQYIRAKQLGLADNDFASVIKAYEKP